MKYELGNPKIIACTSDEKKAADILAGELEKRTGKRTEICAERLGGSFIELTVSDGSNAEDFEIIHTDCCVKITAHRLRGLIYGMGALLRKSVVENGKLYLVQNITCKKSPSMKIRGHQLSYKIVNNTCDAWDREEFTKYITELMFFGMNTVEGSGGEGEQRNALMKYSIGEALAMQAEVCAELDADFSLWHPLTSSMTDEETVEDMQKTYSPLTKLDVLFPPGGDPGDLTVDCFIERCKKIKTGVCASFPDMQLWPSAQAPHEYPDWGEKFKAKMDSLPDEIDGLIYGPNHAMPIDEMRRSVDLKYPFRFYPDITHNVRCEVPVHFNRDDWHYALAATLSRESVNPRPTEYRLLHRRMRQYFCGSVTYSEGVNDDLNKCVWSAMDFDFDVNLREAVADYARLFFPGTDTEALTDAVFGLELNWVGDPAENPSINPTCRAFEQMRKSQPELMKNWRFVLHLFRAHCDKLVRDRRLFELDLISRAKQLALGGSVDEAVGVLGTEFPEAYKKMRAELFELAELLHAQIGIQLDVEHFGGLSWERGCTLDTIDNPVTDRRYLLKKLTEHPEWAAELFNRNAVDCDEYYFSFAEHGFDVAGVQEGEYYMNFRGDSNFDAEIPMCITKVYDHFNFKTKAAGLTGGDYRLRVTYKTGRSREIEHHRVAVNGFVLHDGGRYGGTRDLAYEEKFLAGGYVSVVYDVPQTALVNGCAELEITEPTDGFMIAEFKFEKASKTT